MSIAFVVPGKAVGKGRPRATRVGAKAVRLYTPPKTAAYEETVAFSAAHAMAGFAMFDGPVTVQLDVECEPPKSWSKKAKTEALAGLRRPTAKPDIDNTIKAIFDAINGVVWVDDSQVVAITAIKRYAEADAVFVMVTPAQD